MSIEVKILGPLQVLYEGQDVTPSAPKPRTVLTLLALHAGRLVPSTMLMDELWGEGPPASASTTLQTYVYQIRKMLQGLPNPAPLRAVETRNGGYLMSADVCLDIVRFRELSAEGRRALQHDQLASAVECLHAAARIWRGPVLTDVNVGQELSALRASLNEDLLQTHEMRIEAERRLGHDRELIAELRRLVSAYPLHEEFSAQLMESLYRVGRRSEALQVYRELRGVLHDELGVEPSGRVGRLHQQMLSSDESTDAPAGPVAAVVQMPSPAQLPPDVPDLVGRGRAEARVRAVLSPANGARAKIAVITGPAGVGKTALAVRAARLLRPDYPDGQFYAELRGPDGQETPVADVIASFVRSLGLPPDRIPTAVVDRSALFRSWSADRRVLVVLDGVRNAAQVLSLLPGGCRCAVLITSARPLPVLSGACNLRLGQLPAEDGVRLLETVVGQDRVQRERTAATELVELCEGLPVALRAAAAHLAGQPSGRLHRLVDLLSDEDHRLAALDCQEFHLSSRMAAHFATLDPHEQRAVQALSTIYRGDFRLWQAAEALVLNLRSTETLLNRLVQAHVLVEGEDVRGESVYRVPGLMRLHARRPVAHAAEMPSLPEQNRAA